MTLIGKRGDYYFYQENSRLKLLATLPEVQPDHIIAGGAPIAVIMRGRVKDIDVWVSNEIPEYAIRESEFAFNYDRRGHPSIQYMKIKATTPSKLLDSFDIDACKCAFYNITETTYSVCLHKYLKPLVYQAPVIGVCGVNPKAYNRFSTMRFHKYANKFQMSPMEMYSAEDYAKALKLSAFSNRSIEEISEAIASYPREDHYELLEHLQNLFEGPEVVRFGNTTPVTLGARAFPEFVTLPTPTSNFPIIPIQVGII